MARVLETIPHLDVARRVLRTEIAGLEALAAGLDDAFTRAVDLLAAVSGRVIVTGMGKSGHVARKIAATFASTGTPAQFVHPAEASHGDLGMIAAEDAVLALSNSGDTAELGDVARLQPALPHPARRHDRGRRQRAGRGRRRDAAAARLGRGLPDGPRAHHLDDR